MKSLLTLGLALVLPLGLPGTGSAGLTAYFALDGNARNLKGVDGTEHGTVSYVPGRFGLAAAFDSGSDHIDLNSGVLGAVGTGDFSISLWVLFNGVIVSDPAFFSNKNWSASGGGGGFSQGLNFSIKPNGNLDINTATELFDRIDFEDSQTSDLSPGRWHNLILVRSGATMTYYFDGASEDGPKSIMMGGNYESAFNFILGDDGTMNYNETPGGMGQWWENSLMVDELSVYDTALTPEEISYLQNSPFVPIPEPQILSLLILGLPALALRRRRV